MKLGYGDVEVEVVLEEDGTIVDDDNFQCMTDNTRFQLIRKDEQYRNPCLTGMKSDQLYVHYVTQHVCILVRFIINILAFVLRFYR